MVSFFMDYFDSFISKEHLLTRLGNVDKMDTFNNYRYTLIIGETCYDFIIRYNKPMLISNGLTYALKQIDEVNVKFLCRDENTMTTFIARRGTYPDLSNLCKKLGVFMVIIQDRGEDINRRLDLKTPPRYDLSAKIWKNPNLSELGFTDEMIKAETIGFIVNNFYNKNV